MGMYLRTSDKSLVVCSFLFSIFYFSFPIPSLLSYLYPSASAAMQRCRTLGHGSQEVRMSCVYIFYYSNFVLVSTLRPTPDAEHPPYTLDAQARGHPCPSDSHRLSYIILVRFFAVNLVVLNWKPSLTPAPGNTRNVSTMQEVRQTYGTRCAAHVGGAAHLRRVCRTSDVLCAPHLFNPVP
ncbi:hypothetical protein C8J57DRAFT_1319254 [Mycena rebaudengoi]|nr:hypothetical protein C8J57DRAFT_1319254 [Mycena rebaudengoi]